MTTYSLIQERPPEGPFRIRWCPSNPAFDTLLIVRYDAGDCDFVTDTGEGMHRALYDEYQCNDLLHDGDTFAVDGKPLYRCEGVHVLLVANNTVNSRHNTV